MGGIQGLDEKETIKRASICVDFSSNEFFKAIKLLRKHGFKIGSIPTADGLIEIRCYENGILKGEFTDLAELKNFLEKR